MAVINVIDDFLKAHNYKRSDLARLCGLPYTTIDGIYKRGDENLRLPTLKKIAAGMGITLDMLVYGPEAAHDDSVRPAEFEMLKRMRALDDAGRSCVMDMLALQEMKMAEKEKSQRQGA